MSKIKLALDVVNDLRSLAASIETLVQAMEGNEEPQESQPEENEAPKHTIEEVRAAMADKSRDGFREGVKAILQKYEADKLTSLDPQHYEKVLKEVGDLK